MIFRLLNVEARRSASAHGSPSPSTSDGKASTSSSKTHRQGAERSPVALLAPVSSRIPPGNSFENIVLPESRLRAGATFSARHGVSWINESRRCLLKARWSRRSSTQRLNTTLTWSRWQVTAGPDCSESSTAALPLACSRASTGRCCWCARGGCSERVGFGGQSCLTALSPLNSRTPS